MNAKKITLGVVGISVILISTTLFLVFVFSENEAIPSSDAEIKNDIAYVSNNEGLAIFKILNEINARKVKQIKFDETAFGVSLVNDRLYVSGGFGMKIFDLNEDPENPTLLGEYNRGGGMQISINNSLAFLTFMNGGLEIIDIQDPINPTLVGQFSPGEREMDVEVVGTTIYLANPDRGLEVVSGSNLSNPQMINTLPIIGAWDIWRVDNLLYLGCHSNGVRIINITTPTAPTVVSTYPSDGDVYALAGDHELLYVGNFYGRIEVLNVSNPAQPSRLDMTPEEYSSHGMYYDGTYAYLVGHHTQFSILKYDANITELQFYSEVTTKSACWNGFMLIPTLGVATRLWKKRKQKKFDNFLRS